MHTGWGTALRNRREAEKLRQVDVAEALGLSTATISNWEHEFGVPTVDVIERYAALLNWSVADFLRYGLGIPLAPRGAERLPVKLVELLLSLAPEQRTFLETFVRSMAILPDSSPSNPSQTPPRAAPAR